MKKVLFIVFFITLFYSQSLQQVFAQFDYEDGCTAIGECRSNKQCVIKRYVEDKDSRIAIVGLSTDPNCNSSSIGGVKAPPGIAVFDRNVTNNGGNASGQNIGIILFISNLLRVFTIIAGIWAMFNLLYGGYIYITSMSDSGATEKVKNSLTMTVIGIAIIAGAYIFAAVIGALMFGDPNFILQPELQGALQGTTPTP